MNEPGRSVTVKLDAPATMDSMAASVPLTVTETPLAVMIASVVSVTSLNAARASPGRSSAAIEPESKNFFMSVRC